MAQHKQNIAQQAKKRPPQNKKKHKSVKPTTSAANISPV